MTTATRRLFTARTLVRWSTVAVLFALLLTPVAVPVLSGERWIAVQGGSMSPTLQVGDIIVTDPHGPTGVGDVVTVRHPDSSLVTHRIIGVDENGSLILRGDANTVTDPDPVPRTDVVGTVDAVIARPWSTVLRASTSPVGRISLVGAIILLLFTPALLARSGRSDEDRRVESEPRRPRPHRAPRSRHEEG